MEEVSSEEDDKTQQQFWRKSDELGNLPENVKKAIMMSKLKAKHSEFHYKMKDLLLKINVYKNLFDSRVPYYQLKYLEKKKKE